ncbi:MAG TPA: AAA family ATPase [Verrucomicrobiae bacterium]|jgi:hypothetical protein|nr:AAA family ATPase [Verrucomicrobiae bacterium]
MTQGRVAVDDPAVADVDLATQPREELASLEPHLTHLGDELRFAWPALTVEAHLTNHRDGGDGLRAELTVFVAGRKRHWAMLNLASSPAREGVVKKLAQSDRGLPWREMLEHVCTAGAEALRAGEPVVCLMPRPAGATRYLINKLALAGETNVLFGDGGSGKSYLALLLAVAASTGITLPGGLRATTATPVLYLDYESCVEEHQDRLHLIMNGLGLREPPPILYRAMSRPLVDEAATIRNELSRHQVGTVTVDSLAPSCGAEPEGADAAIRAMNAMRSFGSVTRLVLAHVSKASAEQRSGPLKPFGSVFVQNLARNVWEVRRAEEDGSDDLVLGLYHRKINAGRLVPAMALRLAFAPGTLTVHAADLAQQPDLAQRLTLPQRLIKTLAGGARTVADLAEETSAGKDTLTRTLRRLRSQGRVVTVDGDRWGLKA